MANFFKYALRWHRDGRPSSEEVPWYKTAAFYRGMLAATFVVVSYLLFPKAESYKFADLREGSISSREIIAPFTFFVEKSPEELAREQEEARRNVPPVFVREDSVARAAEKNLQHIEKAILAILESDVPDSVVLAQIREELTAFRIVLGEDHLGFFLNFRQEKGRVDRKSFASFFALLRKELSLVYRSGVLNVNKRSVSHAQNRITVRKGGGEQERTLTELFEVSEARTYLLNRLRTLFRDDAERVRVGYALIDAQLQPNLFFDEAETQRRVEAAIARIPTVKGRILSGERIIDSHERVTREHVDILRSLAKALQERRAETGLFHRIGIEASKVLIIILTQVPFLLFLYFHRRRIWEDRRMLFIIFSSMLFIVVFSAGIKHYGLSKFFIPVALVPLVVTSYQDTRTGFFAALGLSVLVAAQWGNDFELVLVGIVTSAVAILGLGFSRYRKKLANATLFLLVAYLLIILSLGAIRFISGKELGLALASALATSILTPLLAYGGILLFDTVFDVASEFKLIELSDLNHPLLKMLAMRAPGSYHHSLQVSTLAEAAAEAIGANALLVRVGAYYHDIGKMFMPEYFVENQRGGKNPHDKLSPRISSLILINHVRKGYEFARQNNIPSIVCNFIVEHHGGSLMKFFYEKAKETSKGEEVLESDFRYPGRRPQSKETGILMLADAVEAAVRSIKEPTIGKIRNAVRNIVEEKIHNGDLDDCPLTMRDLRTITETFSNALLGMHHERLEYPGQKEIERRVASILASGNGNRGS